MPFIPHTQDDTDSMLRAIGVNDIDELFDEIPDSFNFQNISGYDFTSNIRSQGKCGSFPSANSMTLCYPCAKKSQF